MVLNRQNSARTGLPFGCSVLMGQRWTEFAKHVRYLGFTAGSSFHMRHLWLKSGTYGNYAARQRKEAELCFFSLSRRIMKISLKGPSKLFNGFEGDFKNF